MVTVKEHDKTVETIIDIVDLEIEDKQPEPGKISESNNFSTKLTDIPKESNGLNFKLLKLAGYNLEDYDKISQEIHKNQKNLTEEEPPPRIKDERSKPRSSIRSDKTRKRSGDHELSSGSELDRKSNDANSCDHKILKLAKSPIRYHATEKSGNQKRDIRSKSKSHGNENETPRDLKSIKRIRSLSRSPIKSPCSTISTINGTTHRISMKTTERSRSKRSKSKSYGNERKTPRDLKRIERIRSLSRSHCSTISTKNGTTYKISMETTNRPKSLITESKIINLDLPKNAPETKTLVALVKAKFSNNLTVEVQGELFKNDFEFLNLPYMIVETRNFFLKSEMAPPI